MMEDGICEVCNTDVKGLYWYSKTKKFDDINYQIAKRDQQVEIFAKYCEFLNSFEPSTKIQITIHNRHIDFDTFKKSMFSKLKDDHLDEYRNEMNNILRDKAGEGSNQSILREKYLTYSVQAQTYEKSIPLFSRLESSIETNFKTLDCNNVTLNGVERLELINDILNPDEPLNFNYSDLLYSNLSTKDYVSPTSLNFNDKDTFMINNKYCSTSFIQALPTDLADNFITRISNIPINLTINLHIKAVDSEKALELVNTKISFMEQQTIDEQAKAAKRGYDISMIPNELKYSLDEALKLRDDLSNQNQRMFKATIVIYTYSDTLEGLYDNINKINSEARQVGIKNKPLIFMQDKGLNATLPLGHSDIDIERTLTTASTAIFIPFTTQELYDKGGLWYGLNALSRNMIFYNRKKLMNYNGWIFGVPGSGKSFAAKEEITNVMLNTDDDIIVIDPEREYSELAKIFKGETIHIKAGTNNYINPMDLLLKEKDPIALKSEFILSLCNLISSTGKTSNITGEMKSLIDRAIILTYNEYLSGKKKEIPTLKDFHDILISFPEPDAKSIALSLELYIKGSLDIFAYHTNVKLDNRFVVFDIKELGTNLKSLAMLVVLDQIWNRISLNRSKGKMTWVYIDEIYLLFQNEYSANYLFELWKRSRKWGAVATGITQNVEDLLLSDTARRMLSNSEFILMFNQAQSDRQELAHLLNISSQQLSYVSNAPAGQGLLFGGGKAVVPFVNNFPKDSKLYSVLTTKLDEIKTLDK